MKKFIFILFFLNTINFLYCDDQDSIEIVADILEWNKEKGQAIATGNASAKNSETIILADKIIAIIDPNSNNQEIKEILANGNVKFTRDQEVATGQEAIYNLYEDIVTLKGKVTLKKEENIIKGEKLVIDFNTGLSKMEGSNSKTKVQMKYKTKEN